MCSDIMSIGPFTVHGYGLMIAIGVICALLVGVKRAKNKGLSGDAIFSLGLVALVSGFIGAKLLYCIVEFDSLMKDPWSVLSGSGFVVYGGIIFGVLAAFVYCRIKKISFLKYFDLAMPSVAIAQGFGRIGCFLAGCCYGCQTDSFLGVVFQNSPIAPNGVKLIPTQLFSSAGDFLIALILILYAKKPPKDGKVGALYLILYSVGRFIIEFFRSDYRGSVGALSTSQFVAIFMLAAGIGMLFIHKLPCLNKEDAGAAMETQGHRETISGEKQKADKDENNV
jgi:phosphatidylglycerol:prolipoprotein diacylglycerol transferase